MQAKQTQQTKNHLTTANRVLKQLNVNVTAEDRAEAQKVLGMSEATIIRYLTGNAKKLDAAAELIDLLRKRAFERLKKMEGTAI